MQPLPERPVGGAQAEHFFKMLLLDDEGRADTHQAPNSLAMQVVQAGGNALVCKVRNVCQALRNTNMFLILGYRRSDVFSRPAYKGHSPYPSKPTSPHLTDICETD